MPGENGVAVRPVLKLGELVAERRPVEVTRDGKQVILQGYVAGKRCPLEVRAEVEAARRVWLAVTGYVTGEPNGGSDFNDDPIAWETYCRDAIIAVVPGMEFAEAGMYAADPDLRYQILTYLEWWQEQPEAAADPEVQGEEAPKLTGAAASPTSRRSTRSASVSS